MYQYCSTMTDGMQDTAVFCVMVRLHKIPKTVQGSFVKEIDVRKMHTNDDWFERILDKMMLLCYNTAVAQEVNK